MAIRISDAQRDIVHINKAFKQLELAQQDIKLLQSQFATLQVTQKDTTDLTQRAYFNTVTFTWTGATSTLSWSTGYVKDKQENVFPVLAGSRVVSASTYYWTAWNKRDAGFMVIQSNLTTITNNPDNLVLGSIYTGTGVQTGTAGGGGSEGGGTGDGVERYKDF